MCVVLYYIYIPLSDWIGPIVFANATSFCFQIDLYDFFGESIHTAVTTVEDAGGNSDQETIPFRLPPPLGK